MNIDLSRLKNNFLEKIDIDDKITIDKGYLQNTEIRSISDIIIKGFILSTNDGLYVLSINIKGEMILPCSITLENVSYPFNILINETLNDDNELNEGYIKINENYIDIMPIIWQYIVMEIPMRVISPKASKMKKTGDGWKLITDEERNKESNDL